MAENEWKQIETFQNINAKKVSAYIFEQLKEAIVLKELLPGEQLLPERELSKIFNASRATIREAIAILKEDGLIEQRRGNKGGTFVLPLTQQDINRTKQKVIQERDNYKELFEYRNTIEPQIVRLVVRNITDDQLKNLELINEQMEREKNREEFRSLDVKFHLALGKYSNNRYFEKAVRMIRLQVNPVLDLLPFDDQVHQDSCKEHIELLKAIANKDEDYAYAVMLNHIVSTANKLNELLKEY